MKTIDSFSQKINKKGHITERSEAKI